MNDDKFNDIDESTISEDMDVVSPEQPINQVNQTLPNQQPNPNNEPLNTISNSVNSLKKGVQRGKELGEKIQNIRSKNNSIPKNIASNTDKKSSDGNEEVKKKSGDGKQSVADKAVNKVASQVISRYTHGVVKAKHIEKLLEESKAVSFAKRRLKIGIAVGVAIGMILIIIITSILMNNDDESLTSLRTNNYITDSSTDEELLEYMGYIAICPSVEEAKQKAKEKGIELPEGEVTFEVMRKLDEFEDIEITPTCLHAMDFYESFKGEYVENKKACYRDRDEQKEVLPDYWRHTDPEASFTSNPKAIAYFINHKDDYDCQIKLPTLLMFETMSYDLTDQDLFNKEYFARPNYVPYGEDLRKLANALSEFMHETCYQWDIQYYLRGTHVENCSGPECSVVKTKVPYDGYYFQVSFDKFVCYLKYGDTCEHPNYGENPLPREKYPDKDYMKHECGGPDNDELEKFSESSSTNSKCPEQRDSKLAQLFPDGVPTSESEIGPYLTDITVPASDVNGNIRNITLTVHKDLVGTFRSIFQELANMKFPIKEAGAYNWRDMASGTGCVSYHSFGVAVDINSADNPAVYQSGSVNKSSPYYINSQVVAVFKKYGFYWGGNWSSKYYDPMHFSYSNH